MSNIYFLRKDKRFDSSNAHVYRNRLILDHTISMESRGLFFLLLSYPDGLVFPKEFIQGKSALEKETYDACLNELIERKYVKTFQVKKEKGEVPDTYILLLCEPTDLSPEGFLPEYILEPELFIKINNQKENKDNE